MLGGAIWGLAAAMTGATCALFGAAMLFVYVGVEIGVGNWGCSYLVQTRALPASLAGYTISGFWLGLTLGRFLISPAAERLRVTTAAMIYACLAGVTVAVNFTPCPEFEGFSDDAVTAVVVLACFTV